MLSETVVITVADVLAVLILHRWHMQAMAARAARRVKPKPKPKPEYDDDLGVTRFQVMAWLAAMLVLAGVFAMLIEYSPK